MKTALMFMMGVLGVQVAFAQVGHLPFGKIGGDPVEAHYVRLEGIGPQTGIAALKATQQLCAKTGRYVELPPEGAPITRMTREDYYTATHLIEFTRSQVLTVTSDCKVKWEERKPELGVHHPYGFCRLDVRTKVAFGRCDGKNTGPTVPISTLRYEVLGRDPEKNCLRTAARVGRIRSEQCVELPPEPWRSFRYRAGPERHGLILEERGTIDPDQRVLRHIRAVEVRKNITVGSHLLDLARTQGFKIVPLTQDHK